MIHPKVQFYYKAFINSYSQLFFSDNKVFAYLLLLSSFIDVRSGASGALAIAASILFCTWIGLEKNSIKYGIYSFNALMVGLVMGMTYTWSIHYFIIVICASILTVLLSVLLHNWFYKYKLPVLSLPFLIGLWLVMLSIRTFASIEITFRDATFPSTLSALEQGLNHISERLNDALPLFLTVYFKSLAAIFFQYNIIAGILSAIGLLVYSRIAFSLSLIGFAIGYFFYYFMVGAFTPLLYSYIGFNFLLTAITLGGYFTIPSARSYALAIIATPIIAILISAFVNLLLPYQLPLFSLPFNLAVILFMMVLYSREHRGKLHIVTRQFYSPEKNLYYFHNMRERFKNDTYFHVHLPFFGEWYISQGIDGKITHKEDWRFAWDFVVTDEMKHTFRLPGTEVTDYYCYNLPVLAPADGTVWEIVEGVEDNPIGEVDTYHNWGNTVIIKHGDFFYSKLSHLRIGSIAVKQGEFVKRGQFLGTCGSSGRSPEPHIHFQLQGTPHIGSKTLKYPLSYYITTLNGKNTFHSFDYPEEGDSVSGVKTTPLLAEAFNFIPGVTMHYEVEREGLPNEKLKWEVFVDAWNQSYIYCHKTASYAYFVNNGTLHYFTEFIGDRNSALHHFYLGANKILLGYYHDLLVEDKLPIAGLYSGISRTLQDIVAPFHIYLKALYLARFVYADDVMAPSMLKIASLATVKVGSSILREWQYEIVVSANRISGFEIRGRNTHIKLTCTDE